MGLENIIIIFYFGGIFLFFFLKMYHCHYYNDEKVKIMEYDGKQKGPYYGVWQVCVILLLVPLIVYLIINDAFNSWTNLDKKTILITSIFISGICGILFYLIAIISGLFKGTFIVVVRRIYNLFSNAKLSIKEALKIYWDDIKMEGIVFWIYLIIFLLFVGITFYSGLELFEIYRDYFQ